jgi:hypothetical protein
MSEHDTGCRCHPCVTEAAMKMKRKNKNTRPPTVGSAQAPWSQRTRVDVAKITVIELLARAREVAPGGVYKLDMRNDDQSFAGTVFVVLDQTKLPGIHQAAQ